MGICIELSVVVLARRLWDENADAACVCSMCSGDLGFVLENWERTIGDSLL